MGTRLHHEFQSISTYSTMLDHCSISHKGALRSLVLALYLTSCQAESFYGLALLLLRLHTWLRRRRPRSILLFGKRSLKDERQRRSMRKTDMLSNGHLSTTSSLFLSCVFSEFLHFSPITPLAGRVPAHPPAHLCRRPSGRHEAAVCAVL